MSKYMEYPKPLEVDHGCRVSWYTYDNETDAEAASQAAQYNADIDEALGYDFGMVVPGYISKEDGKFTVCVP